MNRLSIIQLVYRINRFKGKVIDIFYLYKLLNQKL
jgi:hypothetical protein